MNNTSACLHTYLFVYECMHAYACRHIHFCTFAYLCIYVCKYVHCKYTLRYVGTSEYAYANICISIREYLFKHTCLCIQIYLFMLNKCPLDIVIVIVNSWVLERPQKRSRRNQLIHRRKTAGMRERRTIFIKRLIEIFCKIYSTAHIQLSSTHTQES